MHVTLLLLLLASPTDGDGAKADEDQPVRSRAEWVASVKEALREQARVEDADQPEAVVQLIALYDQLGRNTTLAKTDRGRLRTKLRNRLARITPEVSREVEQRNARIQLMNDQDQEDQRPERIEQHQEDKLVMGRWRHVLAQVPPGGPGGAPGGGLPDHGEDLVELIQTVISPNSWEVNGGPMSIYYFASRRVLVVSATSEVHEQVGGLGRGLRQAGN